MNSGDLAHDKAPGPRGEQLSLPLLGTCAPTPEAPSSLSHSGIAMQVDIGEEVSGIPALLEDAGASIERTRLPAGDYLVAGKVLVERKAAGDFAQSLYDGRLFRQLAYLRRTPMTSLLVVEGASGCYESFWPRSLRGVLLSIAMDSRVPLLFTRRPSGTADLLLSLGRRCLRKPTPEFFQASRRTAVFGRKARRLISVYSALTRIPTIGPAMALRLMGRFNTLEDLRCADAGALARVEGVGPSRARRIAEGLAELREPDPARRAATNW